MALVIEITAADGTVKEIAVTDASTVVTAAPGHSFRIKSDSSSELAEAQIQRFDENLIITGLPDGQTLTLEAFFQIIDNQPSPELKLESFGGASDESLTQSSEPIAALAEGFLLWTGPNADDRQPVAPETEFNWRPFAAVGAGLLVVAGAGGGGGGDDNPVVGSDQTPATPVINTDQVTSPTPVIAGTGTAGSTITILIDLGGTGITVSYRTTVDANGDWAVDTATATPLTGAMPPDGLPVDAPSPIRAVANSAGGNSGLAVGSLEVDETPPVQTATLDAIESDAIAPVGNTELDIRPGRLESGESTNDSSPVLTGTISAPLESSDTVVIVRNGQIIGEAEVTGLDWTYTESNVPTGEHTYLAQVSDPAGNLSAASASITINVDATAPTTPTIDAVAIDDIVTLAEAEAGVLISGSAEAGSTVTVQWGAAQQTTIADSNGVYSTTFESSSLPGDGRTPISVIATDSFGNVSESVTRPVNVVAGLPAAPIIDTDSTLLAGDISAINAREAADGFAVTGTAEPNTPVRITFTTVDAGQAFEATGTVNSAGKFSVTFAGGAVPDGQYNVNASVADFAGQTVEGPVVSILVDTVAPTSTATVSGATDDQPSVVGNLANGATTNDETPTITGSISANLGQNESVLVLRNGEPVGTANVNGRQWQFEEASLPAGQYQWTAVVVDSAGNAGPAGNASFGLTLDLTAPTAPTINALTGDDLITGNDASGGVQVTGTGPAGGQVQLDWAGQIQTVNVNAQGNWSTIFQTPPADGRTQITASVTDAAGNEAQAFRTVQVDTAPPVTPGISTVAGDDVINGAEAAQGVVIAGTGEASTRIDVRWGDLTETTTVSSAGFWSVNFDNVPVDGRSTIIASAVDVGGNRSENATREVTVDTTAPTRPTIQVVEGDDVITATEVADGVAVQGRAQAGSSVTVTWAGESVTTQVASNGEFRVVFTTVPVNGNSTIEVTSTDAAGNTSAVGSRAVVVNTTLPPQAPEVNALTSGDVINASEAANGIAVSGTSQAGSTIRVSWGSVIQTTTTAADGSWSVDYAANEIPADGASTITVSASNAGGNSSTVSVPITIDTTPPAAPIIQVVAGDDVVTAAEAQNGVQVRGNAQADSEVTVQWQGVTEVTQTNNAGVWQVSFDAPANGESTISATAADSAGNTSTAGSREVTVNTAIPPPSPQVLAVTADNAVNAAEAAAGVTISGTATPGSTIDLTWGTFADTTVTAANGTWRTVVPPASVPADGNTIVTATASNAGGTSNPTTATVAVDTTAPANPVVTAVAGDDVISLAEQNNPILVTGTAPANSAVTVNWGNLTEVVNTNAAGAWQVSFATLPPGAETELTASATDAVGNTSATTAHTVTIQEAVAPAAPTISVVSGDDIVNIADANDAISITGTATAGSQVAVTWGDTTESVSANGAGNWSAQFSTSQIPDDGVGSVSAVATVNGLTSNPATRPVTVDTQAPEQLVSIGDLVDNSGVVDISIADGDTTTDLTPEITIGLDSALDPADSIVLTMDGDTLVTLNASDDLTVQLGPISEGAHTFEVQIFDEAQNAGTISDPFTVLFDAAQNLNDVR